MSNDEESKEKSLDNYCPCDDCEFNDRIMCSTCDYGTPAINDTHDYSKECN